MLHAAQSFTFVVSLLFLSSTILRGVQGQSCPEKGTINTPPSQYFKEVVKKDLSDGKLRDDLNKIIKDTHKCSKYRCAANALKDLDESKKDDNYVTGFYSRIDILKSNRGNSADTWSNEHIYPAGRWEKRERTCPDGDLHNLVAERKSVNSDRSNDDFDEVGSDSTDEGTNVENCVGCKEIEGKIWEPATDDQKGQVARILFYMDVRYSDPDREDLQQETDLNLVKQRSDKTKKGSSSELGNLATLLKWHCNSKVGDEERARNDKVQLWQGNRNPFVDYPGFVETIFEACPPGSKNSAENLNPDGSTKVLVNEPPLCNLKPGDVMITGYNADNPDTVVLVATVDIPEDITIYITDNAWTGIEFQNREGIASLTVPPGGIAKGEIIAFSRGEDFDGNKYSGLWNNDNDRFALSTRGDNIMVYCFTDKEKNPSSISHLTALGFSGNDWVDEENSSNSALPSTLSKGTAVTLPRRLRNGYYNGARNGSRDEILKSITDVDNSWVEATAIGTDGRSRPVRIDSSEVLKPFTIIDDKPPKDAIRIVAALVNPGPNVRDEGNEKVTLKNVSSFTIDISNWKIVDKNGGAFELIDIKLEAGQQRTITLAARSAQLVNSKDGKIILKNDNDEVINEVSYTRGQVKEGVEVEF